MSQGADSTARALMEQWRNEFRAVMETMADASLEMAAVPGPPAEAAGDLLWWRQTLSSGADHEIAVAVAPAACTHLGKLVLSAAGIDSSDDSEIKDSYLEVLKQSLGALARNLGSQLGGEVSCAAGDENAPSQPGEQVWLVIGSGADALPPVCLQFSSALIFAVRANEPKDTAEPPVTAVTVAQAAADEPELSAQASRTLDLLMDVELPVSVSFGRAQLKIQDALRLVTGSIVELNRTISEPVEVIVNNCVIARGVVVVINGNYGVRIDQIMSRKERLQQSRKYLLPVHARRD